LQTTAPVTDALNVMSGVGQGSVGAASHCLKGLLAEVFVWGRPLLDREVAVVASGFDYTLAHNLAFASLLAAYPLEEGAGYHTFEARRLAGVASLVSRAQPRWVQGE
jgi:hypothetical protein